MLGIRRREFITLLGSATAWPLAARAQQSTARLRRIGVLMAAGERRSEAMAALQALGWIEGRSVKIDSRPTFEDAERTRANARELLQLGEDVIFVSGAVGTRAFQDLTHTVPIVFVNVADPVAAGFVATLAHPGGNMTGFSNFEFPIGGKWVQRLKEIAPGITRIALVSDPENVNQALYARSIAAVAPSLGVEVTTLAVRNVRDIETGIAAFAGRPGGALISFPNAVTFANRKTVTDLAARHRLPAIYDDRSFVIQGGLMSYGPHQRDMIRGAISYVDRILRGEKPADLPVQQPTRFEFLINLTTARTLGVDVPPLLLAIADEVIE
jgi:putative ABC transport system substrate-binding protein